MPSGVVSPSWLRDNYSSVRVVDASWYMPGEKRDPLGEHVACRLPSSHQFELEACCRRDGDAAGLPHMMPTKQQFGEYMSAIGLQPSDCIVLYDGKGIFSAPRIRATMRHFGVDNVAILDGGIKAWQASGGATESGPLTVQPLAPDVAASLASGYASPPVDFIRTMSEVDANSTAASPSFVLVDARPKGRFDGADPEPRAGLPSGHIQGAVSVPFMSLLDTQKDSGATVMKSGDELVRVFAAAGVDVNSSLPIVGSCGSGVSACVALLGLELAGRSSNVGLYDGSWTEWALRQPASKIITAAAK